MMKYYNSVFPIEMKDLGSLAAEFNHFNYLSIIYNLYMNLNNKYHLYILYYT
jgi:hypothetical protein